MPRLLVVLVAAFAVAAPSWGPSGSLRLGWGTLEIPEPSNSALTLPANPEYHLAAWIDFENGATNGEEIGDTQDVCPSADSATTNCLGQTAGIRRGTWTNAAGCKTDIECWQWGANDHVEGAATGASPSDFDWLGEEPFALHVGLSMDAVLTGFQEVFANRPTTSSNVPGVLIFLDHRLGGRDIVVRVGGAVTQTELDGNDCMLGVDETEPFIVTVVVRASSGADSIEIYVNGASCDTGVMQGYSPSVNADLGMPGTAGAPQAFESYFAWADSETSAGSVAAMESRGDQALAYYAAQLGIALP